MNGTETTKIFADRVSELINEECKKENFTLEELGGRIGVKRSSLSKYQNDNGEPGINSAVKIARYFGVTLDYLCGMEDCTSHENTQISDKTGLADESIHILHNLAQESHKGLMITHSLRLYFDTLNFVIKNSRLVDLLGRYIFEEKFGALCEETFRLFELKKNYPKDRIDELSMYNLLFPTEEDVADCLELTSAINMHRLQKHLFELHDQYKEAANAHKKD